MIDIVYTRGKHEPIIPSEAYSLTGVCVYVNDFQPSVNEARLLALETGGNPYLMWLDPDDQIDFERLQEFINKVNELKPKIGGYVPSLTNNNGRINEEPCDLRKGIYPRETHMVMAVKRDYLLSKKDFFKDYLWGDYLVRVSALTEPKEDFVKLDIPPFYTWVIKRISDGRKGGDDPDEQIACVVKACDIARKALGSKKLSVRERIAQLKRNRDKN